MRLISLLAQPAVFLRSGGRRSGAEPGSEFITVVPSGTVAVVCQWYSSPPAARPIGAPDGSMPGAFVDVVRPVGGPGIDGMPQAPGDYLVSAQVADAVTPVLAERLLGLGVRLFTPQNPVLPGQPGHPGENVLPGPYFPGLIWRF